MKRMFTVFAALGFAASHPGCGATGTGIVTEKTGILFINESNRDVEITVEGCDEFFLPKRQGNTSSRYTARCESTEDVVWTVRAHGEWVKRPGTPPVMGFHEHFATARSGDTVYVRNSHDLFGLHVISEDD